MAIVKNFLGRDMDLPEDRLYHAASHYWFRATSASGASGDTGASGGDATTAATTAGDPGATDASGGGGAIRAGGLTEFDVGTTEPGVALTGGLVELDVLAEAGATIVPSEEVAFATTRKAIKYFMSPVGGTVTATNPAAAADAANESPYSTWFFRMTLAADAVATLVDAAVYAAKLGASEHATEAAAAAASAAKAGKASPTCRSIYSGIKE